MSKKNEAFQYGVMALGALAAVMVLFYYFSDRFRGSENEVDLNQTIEQPAGENAEFVGAYSPSDGPMESSEGRIAYFTVNRKEEGGYLGSVKVDAIGASETFYFNCTDVRIEASEFFLNCRHETKGSISLNGTWQTNEAGQIKARGKVMWVVNGSPVLEVDRQFDHLSVE